VVPDEGWNTLSILNSAVSLSSAVPGTHRFDSVSVVQNVMCTQIPWWYCENEAPVSENLGRS
jgi:hypothetical protein